MNFRRFFHVCFMYERCECEKQLVGGFNFWYIREYMKSDCLGIKSEGGYFSVLEEKQ